MNLPENIYTGLWKTGHIQGITIDKNREYIYYSFTDVLVKSKMNGEIVGYVKGIYGHLGCLTYNPDDDKVYASLEYKNDIIGKQIQNRLGKESFDEDGFYIAIFDCKKIVRNDMSAENDKVMTLVFLKTVTDDYNAKVKLYDNEFEHRHGCSGIDGISFGPDFGSNSSKQYLCVAYGIYSDLNRTDNDYQVILQYDIKNWASYESYIVNDRVERKGPSKPLNKYFLYTGNTTFGIQNLEYDKYTGNWFVFVYRGKKDKFPNKDLYIIDGSVKPEKKALLGYESEEGNVISIAKAGMLDEKSSIYCYECKYGTTGFFSLGDGRYYISEDGSQDGEYFSNVHMYKWNGETPCPLCRM